MKAIYLISFLLIVCFLFPNVSAWQSRSDDLYLNLSKQVAQDHVWTYPHYVCRDFAFDLMIKLNQAGYLASTRTGKYYPCSEPNYKRFRCKHTWVEVYVGNKLIEIESTTGKVIPEDIYKKHYKY